MRRPLEQSTMLAVVPWLHRTASATVVKPQLPSVEPGGTFPGPHHLGGIPHFLEPTAQADSRLIPSLDGAARPPESFSA